MTSPPDIVSRIFERISELNGTERKVADAILQDVTGCASASISEMAARAGVSVASITRFAKTLGCADVRELKLALARASAVGERFYHNSAPGDGGDPGQTGTPVSRRIHQGLREALDANHGLIDAAAMAEAAQTLACARMIYVLGQGGASTLMADEARYRLFRLRRPVASYSDGVLQRMVAASVLKEDVLLVFSASGALKEQVETCAIARNYGARVIAVTVSGSPLAGLADIHIPIKSFESDFIFMPSSTRYAMLLMLDTLVTELALSLRPHSQDALRRIKYVLDDYRGGDDPPLAHDRQPLGD